MVDAAEATGRGPDWRSAGSVDVGARSPPAGPPAGPPVDGVVECAPASCSAMKPACAASENPRGIGVPAAVSSGGGVGLPDLPREARAFFGPAGLFAGWDPVPLPDDFGVFGALAIAPNMACLSSRGKMGRAERQFPVMATISTSDWSSKIGAPILRAELKCTTRSRHPPARKGRDLRHSTAKIQAQELSHVHDACSRIWFIWKSCRRTP